MAFNNTHLILSLFERKIPNMIERIDVNSATGKQVLEREGNMELRDLERHWAQIFPDQVEKLDANLSVFEIVNLISTSRMRAKLAARHNMQDSKEAWYAMRDLALLKALEMKTSGNPDIKILHEFDSDMEQGYQERMKFVFNFKGSIFKTSVAVVSLMERTNLSREEVLAKAGDFEKDTFLEDLDKRKSYIPLKKEIANLTGTEEERIDRLLRREFSSQELAELIYKMSSGIEFLGVYARKGSVQLSPRTKQRFLMRAADLKRDGTEGIEISERDGKRGSGKEVVYAFDRQGRPPYITYVKACDLERNFPDYKECCGLVH